MLASELPWPRGRAGSKSGAELCLGTDLFREFCRGAFRQDEQLQCGSMRFGGSRCSDTLMAAWAMRGLERGDAACALCRVKNERGRLNSARVSPRCGRDAQFPNCRRLVQSWGRLGTASVRPAKAGMNS